MGHYPPGWSLALHFCPRAHSPSACAQVRSRPLSFSEPPAAAACHEVSPDRHASTSGPEHHQVSLSSPEISLGAPVPTPPLVPRAGPREPVGTPQMRARQLVLRPRGSPCWLASCTIPSSTRLAGKARGEAKKCRAVYGIEHRDQCAPLPLEEGLPAS